MTSAHIGWDECPHWVGPATRGSLEAPRMPKHTQKRKWLDTSSSSHGGRVEPMEVDPPHKRDNVEPMEVDLPQTRDEGEPMEVDAPTDDQEPMEVDPSPAAMTGHTSPMARLPPAALCPKRRRTPAASQGPSAKPGPSKRRQSRRRR